MASAAYNAWVARIRAAGGRISIAPSKAIACTFPNNIRGPVATQDCATQATETYKSQTSGYVTHYFHAPQWVQIEVNGPNGFGVATDAEADAAADNLLEQWGIPSPLRSLGNFSSAVTWLIGAAVLALLLYVLLRRR